MDIANALKSKLGGNLCENVVLKPFNQLRVGGVADYFYEARTLNELINAVSLACTMRLPYFVLGGGSQIIFSDFGYPGLIIKNLTSNISFITPLSQVIVDSGVNLNRLVMEAASRDLGGIEFLATVFGSAGGAIYKNKGNFGYVIASYIKSATIFFPPSEIKTVPGEWFEFGYLTSRLARTKKSSNFPPIILSTKLQLQHYNKPEILRKIGYFRKLANFDEIKTKKASEPVFKNPSGMPSALGDDPQEIAKSATEVIKKLNVLRLRAGKVSVFSKDPNRLIVPDHAKAQDIAKITHQISQIAAEKSGIRLVQNFDYVGKWD